MKVALGALISIARGSIGGAVFTKTKSGPMVRVRIKPSNPRTAAQSSVRSYLTSASRAFKGLDAGELAAWNDYAGSLSHHNTATGQAFIPSGIDVFVQLAAKFLQVTPAGTIPTDPPAEPFAGDAVTVGAAATAAGEVTFTASGANATNVSTEVLLQRLKSANRKPNPKGFKSYGFKHMTGGSLTKVLSDLTPGVYVPAYKFVQSTDGQQTGLVVLDQITVT